MTKDKTLEAITSLNNNATEILKRLDTIASVLVVIEAKKDLAASVINEEANKHSLTIKNVLTKYNLPIDDKFTNDIQNLIERLELDSEDYNKVFANLDIYQHMHKIKDIKLLAFKFLHNYAEDKRNGSYN